jgi:small subunit ribosomal protein S16
LQIVGNKRLTQSRGVFLKIFEKSVLLISSLWTFVRYTAKNTLFYKNVEILVALKIRLARGGAKKRPFYRMVVTDSRNPRDGAFLEKVGSYDPFLSDDNPNRVVAKTDRITYWLSVGAKLSDRAATLLNKLGLCEKPIVRETPKKSAPKKKAQERLEALRQAAAASAE